MNLKKEFLSVMRGEKPKWIGDGFAPFPDGPVPDVLFYCYIDPITTWDILWIEGDNVIDNWGVTHRYHPGEDPGIIPMVTDENKVIKDITKWRDYVNFPEIPTGLDWSVPKKRIAEANRDESFVMVPSFRGLFERAHCLMTFEDSLIYLYEEPEAMYELFGAYADWKIKVFEQLIDNLNPDILLTHDDWGSGTGLFFSPAKFRELLYPHYERMYNYVNKRGVLIQHHADCYCQGLEKDMVDLKIDMWQGVYRTNDIQAIKKNTGGKLLLIGGIDQALIDKAPGEITEEEIRAEVRRTIDEYAPGGSFLPCIPSTGCLNDWVNPIVIDEANRYGAEWVKKNS